MSFVDRSLDGATEPAGTDPDSPWTPSTERDVTPARRLNPNLPNTLRLVGAALLALSLSRFLLAGVDVDNDLQRFALLLLQSAAFTGAGFAVARWLGDLRGARLLFGIALLSVPAGFTVLGAMVYSLVPLDALEGAIAAPVTAAARELPGFALWQVGSVRDIGLAALATALVLAPTTFFGFATLARRSAARLGGTLLACSALLLVPVRAPDLAGALTLAAFAVALWTWRALRGTDDALVTVEGRFAQALLAVPAVIITARTLVVDDPGAGFAATLALAGLLGLRTAILAVGRDSRTHLLLLPAAAACALAAVPGLEWILRALPGLRAETGAVVAMLLVGALLVELARHTDARRTVAALETLWALPLLVGTVLLGLFEGLPSALWPAGAVLGLALLRRRPGLAAVAVVALVWPFASGLGDWMMAHRWAGLSVLGVTVIVGAGIVQRRVSAGTDPDAERQEALPA